MFNFTATKLIVRQSNFMNIDFKSPKYFVTGIDTDAGKSYAVAALALAAAASGKKVITSKLIQTGCDPEQVAEDIVTHRRLQGIELLEEDLNGLTCPQIFRLPSSPHLAAEKEGREVDLDAIIEANNRLEKLYDVVIIEGAGGIMVPLKRDFSTADFIVQQNLPTIIVSSARLGSLNHTLLTLEYARSRGIELAAVVYNLYPESDPNIEVDTRKMIESHLAKHFPGCPVVDLPRL